MADFKVTGTTLVPEGIWGDYVAYHVQVTPRCLPEAPEWCPFSDSNSTGNGANGNNNNKAAESVGTRQKCESFIVYRRFNDFKILQASLRLHAPPIPAEDESSSSGEISVADFKARYALPSDNIASWFSKRSTEIVLERSHMLSLWLSDVFQEGHFQRSRPLRLFLTDNANEAPTGAEDVTASSDEPANRTQPSMVAEGKELALSFRNHLKSEAKKFIVAEKERAAASEEGIRAAEDSISNTAGSADSERTIEVSPNVHEDETRDSAFESDDSDADRSAPFGDDAQQVQCFDFLVVAASSAIADISSRQPPTAPPTSHLFLEAEPQDDAAKATETENEAVVSITPPPPPSALDHVIKSPMPEVSTRVAELAPALSTLDVDFATIAFEQGWRKWAIDGVKQQDVAAAAAIAVDGAENDTGAGSGAETPVSLDTDTIDKEQGWRKWATDAVMQQDDAAAAAAAAATTPVADSSVASINADAAAVAFEQGWRSWASSSASVLTVAAADGGESVTSATSATQEIAREWPSVSKSVVEEMIQATKEHEILSLQQQKAVEEAEEQAERVKSRQRKEARKHAAAQKDQANSVSKARARADSVNARLAAANPALAAKLNAAAEEQKLQHELRSSGSSSRRRRTSSSSSSDSNRDSASDSLVSSSASPEAQEDVAAPRKEATSEPTDTTVVSAAASAEEPLTDAASSPGAVSVTPSAEAPAVNSSASAVDATAPSRVAGAPDTAATATEVAAAADTVAAAADADEAMYESMRAKAAIDTAIAFMDQQGLGHVYQSLASAGHGTLPEMASLDLHALLDVGLKKGHALKMQRALCQWTESYAEREQAEAEEATKVWEDAKNEAANKAEIVASLELEQGSNRSSNDGSSNDGGTTGESSELTAARNDAATAAATADRLGKLAKREVSEAATAAAELQAVGRGELAKKADGAEEKSTTKDSALSTAAAAKAAAGSEEEKASSSPVAFSSSPTADATAAAAAAAAESSSPSSTTADVNEQDSTSGGVDSPQSKRNSDFTGLSSMLGPMPCSVFASDVGFTVCGPRSAADGSKAAASSEATGTATGAAGAARTTQDQGSVLHGLPSVEAQASVLVKLKTAQTAAAVLELKLRGDYRDVMKALGAGAGASVALELDRAWSSVVPKPTVKVLGTPDTAAQIVACDSPNAMSRLLSTFPTKQGAALLLELYRRGAGSPVLEALATEKPAAAAVLLSTLVLPPSSSKSSSNGGGYSGIGAGGDRAALLNGFESVEVAAAVLGQLSGAEKGVILNSLTDDKRAQINEVLDSESPKDSRDGNSNGSGTSSDSTNSSSSSGSASGNNEVSEISSSFRAACGYGNSLNMKAFKALVQRLLLVPSSKNGSKNAAAPSEKDLEAAFALADGDKSGGVDEQEFLALFELVKQGAVKGLGKKSFFGSSSSQKKQASAFQASFQEERNKIS